MALELKDLELEVANLQHQLEALKANGNAIAGALQFCNALISKVKQQALDVEAKAKEEISKLEEKI